MLNYTGHPLVDVGIATITAYAGKRHPNEIMTDDLEKCARFIEGEYFKKRWNKMISISFTRNALYMQKKVGKEKKRIHRQTFLYGFQTSNSPSGAGSTGRCVFCGESALTYAYRDHVPLLTARNTINFFPQGKTGLPVCGVCALASQAFLLGSVRCAGWVLFVHADDEDMTLEFARRFLTENRRFLSLQSVSDEEEDAQNLKHARTFFVARLLEIETERQQAELDEKPCSITVYHLTNYGTNPEIRLYHLPYPVLSFLRQVRRAPHGNIWRQVERRAWELAIENEVREEPGRARNYLYEDLFELPHNAAHFVRTYFLRRAYRARFDEDPRRSYSLQRELDLVSWTLTAIFLKEVMKMDPHRIETIRCVADRLAEYVSTSNDRQLFRGLWMSRRYGEFRRTLVATNMRCVKNGTAPLLTFEDFVTVFEFGEDSQRPDWNLARDLVLIRVIEQLHQREWFRSHADVISEEEIPETTEVATE